MILHILTVQFDKKWNNLCANTPISESSFFIRNQEGFCIPGSHTVLSVHQNYGKNSGDFPNLLVEHLEKSVFFCFPRILQLSTPGDL